MSRAIDQKVAAIESDEENKRELLRNEINQCPPPPCPFAPGTLGDAVKDERVVTTNVTPALEWLHSAVRNECDKGNTCWARSLTLWGVSAISLCVHVSLSLSCSRSRFFPHPLCLPSTYNHASPLSHFFTSRDVTDVLRYFVAFINFPVECVKVI